MTPRTDCSILTLMAISLICASFTGCGGTKEKYGRDYDPERIKRGIPPIGPDAHTSDDWGLYWHYDDHIVKGRTSKMVDTTRDGELVWEMDCYQSGVRFTTSDGRDAYETLQVVYSYEAERRGTHPWSAVHDHEGGTDELETLSEIEQLLQSWGVDRLKVGTRSPEEQSTSQGAQPGN